MTRSLTLAWLPRAGANVKHQAHKQNIENEGSFEKMGFNRKTV